MSSPPAPQCQCWGHIQAATTEPGDEKKKKRRPTSRVTTLRLGGEGGVKRSPLQKCCNISFAYRLGLLLFIEFLDPGKDCVLSTDLFLRSTPSTRRNTETRGYCYVFKCTHTHMRKHSCMHRRTFTSLPTNTHRI